MRDRRSIYKEVCQNLGALDLDFRKVKVFVEGEGEFADSTVAEVLPFDEARSEVDKELKEGQLEDNFLTYGLIVTLLYAGAKLNSLEDPNLYFQRGQVTKELVSLIKQSLNEDRDKDYTYEDEIKKIETMLDYLSVLNEKTDREAARRIDHELGEGGSGNLARRILACARMTGENCESMMERELIFDILRLQ